MAVAGSQLTGSGGTPGGEPQIATQPTSTPSTRYEPDRGLATDEDDGDYGEYGKWASGQR